ncbi:hypothetical protein [Streptomyces sp. NPDC056069]|uniref:hypothetical protein n=1 Tax=Streptomyces sp. NPDC056069 TaxID=3345702 RepID=UPI0035D77682
MAIHTTEPVPVTRDLVTYSEAKSLFRQTGHGVSESTMRRWVGRGGIATATVSGKVYLSFSDLLVAHGDWVAGIP